MYESRVSPGEGEHWKYKSLEVLDVCSSNRLFPSPVQEVEAEFRCRT